MRETDVFVFSVRSSDLARKKTMPFSPSSQGGEIGNPRQVETEESLVIHLLEGVQRDVHEIN